MLTLRAYRNGDAENIAKWLTNEREFLWWSAGKLGAYPLKAETLDAYWAEGIASGDFFPKVMEEDGETVGSLLMRREADDRIHFGFIVVDGSQRGKGLGYAMLAMALEYAFHVKGAKRVTLNVFADNAPAIRLYERLGFSRADEFEAEIGGKKARLFCYEKKR